MEIKPLIADNIDKIILPQIQMDEFNIHTESNGSNNFNGSDDSNILNNLNESNTSDITNNSNDHNQLNDHNISNISNESSDSNNNNNNIKKQTLRQPNIPIIPIISNGQNENKNLTRRLYPASPRDGTPIYIDGKKIDRSSIPSISPIPLISPTSAISNTNKHMNVIIPKISNLDQHIVSVQRSNPEKTKTCITATYSRYHTL